MTHMDKIATWHLFQRLAKTIFILHQNHHGVAPNTLGIKATALAMAALAMAALAHQVQCTGLGGIKAMCWQFIKSNHPNTQKDLDCWHWIAQGKDNCIVFKSNIKASWHVNDAKFSELFCV